jgi:hypothetical protein
MNKAAQALGRLAKGVPKTLTDEQRTFRAAQLAAARKNRHKKPKHKAGNSRGERPGPQTIRKKMKKPLAIANRLGIVIPTIRMNRIG